MRKFYGVLGLFAVCFIGGYFAMFYTTDVNSVNRDPAAVRNNFDFSHLQGASLQEAVKQRLIAGFEVQKAEEGTGISLGHFAFTNDDGKKLGCQEYETVTLRFEAEGVVVSGDSTVMEIEGRCEFSSDLAKINPLVVPFQKIMGEHPGDGEFKFNTSRPVVVRFTNLSDAWPTKWILKSVKLSGPQNNQGLTVDSSEISKYLGHPVVLTF